MPKYKVTINEEFIVNAEDEETAVWEILEGLDLGNLRPDVEEVA